MLLVDAVSQLVRNSRVKSLCLGMAALSLIAAAGEASDWKAGVAKADITPDKPMWMSG